MTLLNVGIVGCGHIATARHLPAWKHLMNVKIVAVTDVDLKKAKHMAEQFRVEKVFTDFHDMLDLKDLNIVDIATPPKFHAEQAIDACKSGFHAIVEKPMASDSKSAEEMITTARKHNVKLTIYHTQRFYSCIERAKSLVDSGAMGDVFFCRSVGDYLERHYPPWVVNDPKSGGPLFEIGGHHVYLTLFFLGDVFSLQAFPLDNLAKGFHVTMRGKRCNGVIDLYRTECKEGKIEVYVGENGIVCFPRIDVLVLRRKGRLPSDLWWVSEYTQFIKGFTKAMLKYLVKRIEVTPHFSIIKRFVDCVLNDTDPPVPPQEGLKTVKILEAIRESLEKGRAVCIS